VTKIGPGKCRVVLADDHTLVREGLRRLLEGCPGIAVVAEAADGAQAMQVVEEGGVDVLVLDLSMPGPGGLEVLRRVKALRPETKVVVLTMHSNPEYVARAVREGAEAYLLKDSAVADLVTAIETVRRGEVYYSPQIQRRLGDLVRGKGAAERPLDRLTEREREVLVHVARGLSTKEIAAKLRIGGRTVETHRANLMRKLDLHSVAELTQLALREGLLGPP
jgi:DNA-binding NarL/FixJ family response regulator